jgi:hypothetical protein
MPSVPRDLYARHAWRGAVAAASLNAAGMPLEVVLGRAVRGMPWWPPALSGAVGAALLVLLLLRRRTATTGFSAVVYSLNIAVILVALWITSGHYATAEGTWIPFQANKLGALASAMLAPGLGVGLGTIFAFVAMVLVRYQTFVPEIQSRLPIGEPWLILFYGLFSVVLLVYRVRSYELERERARVWAEAAMLERMAMTFRALRDYANTPLQTIEICAGMIRERSADLEPILERMDRAVARLVELSRVFTAYEANRKWTRRDVSFDPNPLLPSRRPRLR